MTYLDPVGIKAPALWSDLCAVVAFVGVVALAAGALGRGHHEPPAHHPAACGR